MLIVSHVPRQSCEIIKWIAGFRAEQRVHSFLKFTQPAHVTNNKGGVTWNTKTSFPRQLQAWAAAHGLSEQGGLESDLQWL